MSNGIHTNNMIQAASPCGHVCRWADVIRRGLVMLALGGMCSSWCASAVAQDRPRITISFGFGPIAPEDAIGVKVYTEQGMKFYAYEPNSHFTRFGGNYGGFPRNDSKYVGVLFTGSLAVMSVTAPSFGLASIDIAEYSTVFPTPMTVPFIGFRPDGAQVYGEFTTDGIIDGVGPLADFETFYFDSRFDNITRLEFVGTRFMVDNVVVKTAVPEPLSWHFLAIGGSAMLLFASRIARSRTEFGT